MRAGRTAVLVAAGLTLAGCMDYLDRRETVSFGAGDAQQVNTITHVIHPQPPHAANRRMAGDGERFQGAVERYRTGAVEDVQAPSN